MKSAKKESNKIHRRKSKLDMPADLNQLEKHIRALKRPPRPVKAISESTDHFKTGRYES
jgi:hypothetical protein